MMNNQLTLDAALTSLKTKLALDDRIPDGIGSGGEWGFDKEAVRCAVEGCERATETVKGLVNQFAYECGTDTGPALVTAGLSALEGAFDFLGWSDPYQCPERKCQTEGCLKAATCGTSTPEGYKRLCYRHYDRLQGSGPQSGGEGSK